MVLIAIILGCVLGVVIGLYAPMISYTYSGYLAIAIVARRFCIWRDFSNSKEEF